MVRVHRAAAGLAVLLAARMVLGTELLASAPRQPSVAGCRRGRLGWARVCDRWPSPPLFRRDTSAPQHACSSTTPIAARAQQSAPVSSVDSVLRPPHLTAGECALGWWVSPIFSLVLLRAVCDWSPCHHTARWSLQATRLRGCRTDLVGTVWCTRATHEWARSRQIDVCVWSACTSVAGSGSALATCNPCVCVCACVRACGCLAVGTR